MGFGISRDFERGSQQYLEASSFPDLTTAMTFACKFKLESLPTAGTNFLTFASKAGANSGDDRNFGIDYRLSTNKRLEFNWSNATPSFEQHYHEIDLNTSQWYSLMWTSDFADANLWVDGVSKALTVSGSVTVSVADTQFCRIGNLRASFGFDGLITNVGFWSVELTEADAVSLHKGASPSLIRPDALVSFPDLKALTDNYGDGRTWSDTSGSVASTDHPGILMPSSASILAPPSIVCNLSGTVTESLDEADVVAGRLL